MIQLIPQLQIRLACKPIDFRNGIDGLAALCKKTLEEDPFSGTLFVFRNRRGTALKLLRLRRSRLLARHAQALARPHSLVADGFRRGSAPDRGPAALGSSL